MILFNDHDKLPSYRLNHSHMCVPQIKLKSICWNDCAVIMAAQIKLRFHKLGYSPCSAVQLPTTHYHGTIRVPQMAYRGRLTMVYWFYVSMQLIYLRIEWNSLYRLKPPAMTKAQMNREVMTARGHPKLWVNGCLTWFFSQNNLFM